MRFMEIHAEAEHPSELNATYGPRVLHLKFQHEVQY